MTSSFVKLMARESRISLHAGPGQVQAITPITAALLRSWTRQRRAEERRRKYLIETERWDLLRTEGFE